MRGSSVLAPGHGRPSHYLVTPPRPSIDLVSHKGCRGNNGDKRLIMGLIADWKEFIPHFCYMNYQKE